MSIERRKIKTGTTRYEVRLRDAGGREYSRSFRTRKDAETFQARERADRSRGAWVDPRRAATTFAEVAAWWLRSNPSKRAGSRLRDEGIIRLHLSPTIGQRRIGTLTPVDARILVTAWIDRYSARTVRRHYAVLQAICNAAVEADYVARTPCRGIKLPTAKTEPRPIVDAEQVARLANAAGKLGPMVYVAAVLGLRWGECAGLRVGDLDFLRSTLTVSQQRPAGATVASEPKSHAGLRTMTVPSWLMADLAALLADRSLTGADSDALVFVGPAGLPLDYGNWRRRVWQLACHSVGMDGLRFHDLRRASATVMVLRGVDVKSAQTRLGHSDPRLTLAVYAQATTEGDRIAAEVLGDHFRPASHAGSRPSPAALHCQSAAEATARAPHSIAGN